MMRCRSVPAASPPIQRNEGDDGSVPGTRPVSRSRHQSISTERPNAASAARTPADGVQ